MSARWMRFFGLGFFCFLTVAGPAGAETLALVGATAHPVSSPPVENAVILVEDGKIAGIGAGLAVPEGAVVIDLAGQHVYPGFIHPGSILGLIEISSVRGTRDTSEVGQLNSNIRAEVAFHADSMLLPASLSGGILTAHVVPQGDGFRGTSAVMRLEGWNWEDMTIAAPAGMHLSYPRLLPRSRSFRPESAESVKERKDKALEAINQALDDAAAYARAVAAADAGTGPAVDFDPRLAALGPVLSGTVPLFIHADEKTQIESALDWAGERGLDNIILVAGPDAAYLGERLAADGIPVILDGVHRRPARDWEPYDTAYTAAARLHEAGVKLAIGDGGGASNARNLPFEAAMAASFGLPKEEALRSITLGAAEILGIDDRLGSLDSGKEATFMVTDGDPLEIRTHIARAWIGGQEVNLSADRQKQLFEKYNNRPRPQVVPPMEAPGG